MDKTIKKYADAGDRENLKYIFEGAFDADPTFEKYEEDYRYCLDRGLFETHVELTPFISDSSKWDDTYWYKLQSDLRKNFSNERLMHMKDVAQIVFAQKVSRLREERKAKLAAHSEVREVMVQASESSSTQEERLSAAQNKLMEQQEKELEATRREIEAHNRAIDAERKREHEKIEQIKLAVRESEGNPPKKALGRIVTLILILIVVCVLIVLLAQNAHASDSPLTATIKKTLRLLN